MRLRWIMITALAVMAIASLVSAIRRGDMLMMGMVATLCGVGIWNLIAGGRDGSDSRI